MDGAVMGSYIQASEVGKPGGLVCSDWPTFHFTINKQFLHISIVSVDVALRPLNLPTSTGSGFYPMPLPFCLTGSPTPKEVNQRSTEICVY